MFSLKQLAAVSFATLFTAVQAFPAPNYTCGPGVTVTVTETVTVGGGSPTGHPGHPSHSTYPGHPSQTQSHSHSSTPTSPTKPSGSPSQTHPGGSPSQSSPSAPTTSPGNGSPGNGSPTYPPTAPSTTVTVEPAPTTVSQCNTGPVQCCNSVQPASSEAAAGIIGLLGIVLQNANVLVGLQCSPLNVVGLGGSTCKSQAVCCQNNTYNGLINIGCSPINL